MKRIAVLTSGGDAPGMNAAIRSVVRTGIAMDWDVFGVRNGYAGLIENDIVQYGLRDVSEIIQRGGTVLGSARCHEFKTREGRDKARANLDSHGIEALIVIGGNGTQRGTYDLHKEGLPVVGVSSTIDNDLYGTDITIGVDTAINIALESIDRLKTTARSHKRAFLVEVMGRDCGYLALMAGIAGGAEEVVIPEHEVDPDHVAEEIRAAYARGKSHALVVVAEGAKNNAELIAKHCNEHEDEVGFALRVTRLGHVQRGGIPTFFDRFLATQLAAGATQRIARGEFGVVIGQVKDEVVSTPLEEVINNHKPLDPELLKLAGILAR